MRTIRRVPIVLVLFVVLWAPQRASAAPGPVEELLALVNHERASAGAPPLALRADLTDIAGAWSVSMAAAGVLAHNDEYFSPATRERVGPGARAENVAYAGDVASVHRVLMASAPHRANLLDGRYTAVGLGAVFDGTVWWVTQAFLAATPAPAAPLPAPPAEPVVTTSTTVVAAPVVAAPDVAAPVVEASAPAAQPPLSIELELQGGAEPVAVAAAPPTSAVGSTAAPAVPRGTGLSGAAWVALLALGAAAAATARVSRGARA